MNSDPIEVPLLDVNRVLAGEVVLLSHQMRALGLFDQLRAASLRGIGRVAGPEVAERAASEGFDHLHLMVDGSALPALNDAVYDEVRKIAAGLMARLVPGIFGRTSPYYYETSPNVRFHIPFDLAQRHRKAYAQYAKARGEGKLTPHGPHRDSWLDCPINAINLWTAVGPVGVGNGLSIFPEVHGRDLPHRASGEVADGVPLGPVSNYPMEPGDVLVFRGDHLHASELNSTARTRHVTSFRLTIGRPRFARAHNHKYTYGPISRGPLRMLGELPAELAWSRVRHVATEGLYRLSARRIDFRGVQRDPQPGARMAPAVSDAAIPDAELGAGEIRALSAKLCIARLEDGSVVAFGRRCPHLGGDLALGTLRDSRVLCPLHNLPIDPRTGRSPCEALRPVETCPVEQIRDVWRAQTVKSEALAPPA
jgi:nitrite reductase/ring-hydroxylating ferredoxin subunit